MIENAIDQNPPAPSEENTHFATGHLLVGMRSRTVSSTLVTGIAQAAQLVLNLGSTVVLARLLAPEDFGLVAMVSTIIGFLRIFGDAGLSTATVQREGITHAQVSNLFWANVAVGGIATLILVVSAPGVAWLFHEPRLVGITLALAVTFLCASLTVQHLALLKRQMRFKAVSFIQVGAIGAGCLVGVVLAWAGFGYWSLVWMQLTSSIVALVLTWTVSRWRPQLPVRDPETSSLLSFGANLSVSSLLWSLARGSDGLLIGRFFGSEALGLYSRAGALLYRPIEQAMTPLEAVFVPTLSRLQEQPERYRRIVFQVYDTIAVGILPFSAMLLALAHPLTHVVLGAKWEGAAPILAAFSLVALYTPMIAVAGWLLASQGWGRDYLVLSCLTSSITVLAFVVGLPFGPIGVAMAFSTSCVFVQLPITYWIAGRNQLVTTKDLWARFLAQAPLWGAVFGPTWLLRQFVADWSPLAQLGVCVPAGLVAALALVCIYSPSRRAVSSVLTVVRESMGQQRVALTADQTFIR